MKTFNSVVALTIDHLQNQADIDAVKQAARVLHYTLATFVGPSGREVIILVRIEKTDGAYSPITHPYSEISGTYPTEEEADAFCQEGHRLAAAIS